ncbi:MAG: hypothetical protein WAL48_15905 [Xanthobacteraceae bacterium]
MHAFDFLFGDAQMADDLAERERDDGEIIAAQPQHRKADGDADNAPYQIITINDADSSSRAK